MNTVRAMLVPALGLLLTGCAGSASSGQSADDAEPRTRITSMAQPQRDADAQRMWELVEALESDDPAVRMMAIASLERITGERRGYEPYDSFNERQAAIERWYTFMEQR